MAIDRRPCQKIADTKQTVNLAAWNSALGVIAHHVSSSSNFPVPTLSLCAEWIFELQFGFDFGFEINRVFIRFWFSCVANGCSIQFCCIMLYPANRLKFCLPTLDIDSI